MSKMGSHSSFGHLKHKLWPIDSSQRELQLCFRPHLNPRSARKVMGLQSRLAQFQDSHSRVPGEKNHFNVGPVERCRVYYKGNIVASPKSGPW